MDEIRLDWMMKNVSRILPVSIAGIPLPKGANSQETRHPQGVWRMLGRIVCLLYMFQLSFNTNPGLIGGTIQKKNVANQCTSSLFGGQPDARCP